MFKRKINEDTVKRSFAVIGTGMFLIAAVTILVSAINPDISSLNIFYMVCSAFGTTGLNPLTFFQMSSLGPVSIIAIACLMFIGQLGVSATLLIWQKPQGTFSYSEEEIKIG